MKPPSGGSDKVVVMKTPVKAPILRYLGNRRIVLGSQSPRRIHLLEQLLGIPITVRPADIEEVYPDYLPVEEVASYLATLKAQALVPSLASDEVLITADTMVLLDGKLIGKPSDRAQAQDILRQLSGRANIVLTGYAITDASGRFKSGVAQSQISFGILEDEDIEYYLSCCDVLDKAGAYGIQDWIGLVAVEDIQGSYNNIIGLPTALIYKDLKEFLKNK